MATTLKAGDKGELVKRLQAALISFGYDLGPRGADGDFGSRTTKAVASFQDARGLPATGVADPDTIAAMDLDPDTLEDLIETEADDDLEARADTIIQDYADTRADFEFAIMNSLQNALQNFETVLHHASTAEARADVMGKVLDKLAETLLGELIGEAAKLNPWATERCIRNLTF